MGSAQSYLSSESALTAIVVAGALGIGYHHYTTTTPTPLDTAGSTATNPKKKTKKKKALEGTETPSPPSTSTSTSRPQFVEPPNAIPGQFDDGPTPPPKAKKSKKKAKPTDPAPLPSPSTSTRLPQTQKPSTVSIDTDGSWTRVESRRRAGGGGGDEQPSTDLTTSDAGITTSVTGNSSPVDDESQDDRKTLAEQLVPKPPKTSVDDLLETPNGPNLARVMRIQPLPNERPAPGFSWADYEDVHVADTGGNDADGEDDGWGVVKSKRPRPKNDQVPVAAKAPEVMTKKQRQNAQKREAQKAAKGAAEAERLATLAKHKRELERIHMLQQSSSKGKTSGGMTPAVDEHGKLVWE